MQKLLKKQKQDDNVFYKFFKEHKTQIIILIITLFPTILLVVSTYFILIYFQNTCFQIVQEFSDGLFQDQITSSKLLNSAIVYQLSSQTQKIIWNINLINQFFGNVIHGKVNKNGLYIPAIHNSERTYDQTENPDVLKMFKENSILTSTWYLVFYLLNQFICHILRKEIFETKQIFQSFNYLFLQRKLVDKSLLSELDQIELKQFNEVIRIESVWKSLQLSNRNEIGRWMRFQDMFYAFDYDGLMYSASKNITFSSYVPPKGCPYTGKYWYDVRCRPYHNIIMENYSTMVFSPIVLYVDVTPYILQHFCKRQLRYYSTDPNSESSKYANLCLTLDLTVIPTYFENFGQNSKLQYVLNPESLNIVYNSESKVKRDKIVNIKDVETKYLQDQDQAKYFLNNITQNYQFILKNSSAVDLFKFNNQENQEVFEYNRNGTECIVIKNKVNFIDKLSSYEYLLNLNHQPKFSIKNAFLFLDILSKEKMEEQTVKVQQKIKELNLIFSYVSLGLAILILITSAKYSLEFGMQFLKPVIHLTNLLNQIITQNIDQKKQTKSSTISIVPTIEDINKDMWNLEELNNYDSNIFKQSKIDQCFSSDTQQLFDSFQNLFKVLAFTTQNLYKDNESASLINLNIQIQHFDKFINKRALGVCYNNIGVIHYQCGRYKESIENFNKSIILAKYELGFYQNEKNEIKIINDIQDCVNYLKNLQQNDNLQEALNKFKQEREINESNQKEDNQINLEKIDLFWNLYNRNLNLVKALNSFVSINKEIYLLEVLNEHVLELISISRLYLPESNKRYMYEYYMLLHSQKFKKDNLSDLKILQNFMNLYLQKFFNKSQTAWNTNFYVNASTFQYENTTFSLLEQPIQQNKKNGYFLKQSLVESYKQYKEQQIKQILKDYLESKIQSKRQTVSASSSKILSKLKLNSSKLKIKIESDQSQLKLKIHNHGFQNQKCYSSVRKIIDQYKLCRYEFSSDIFFQYYALEQAQYQIILKNYKNAGLILTNLLEKCVLYLPHLKKQALSLLIQLFKQQNINNKELLEMHNKYVTFPNTYFKVCTIQACLSKFCLFRSYSIQRDLIKQILFKEEDQFGLINYSFDDNLFSQLAQFTNLKTIKSNKKIFENIFIKIFLERVVAKGISQNLDGMYQSKDTNIIERSQIISYQNRIQMNKSLFQDSPLKKFQEQNRVLSTKPTPRESKNFQESYDFQFKDQTMKDSKNKFAKNFQFMQKLEQRLKINQQNTQNNKKIVQNLQLSSLVQEESSLNPNSLIKRYTFSHIKNNFQTNKTDIQEENIKITGSQQTICNNNISVNKLLDLNPTHNTDNKNDLHDFDSGESIFTKDQFQFQEKGNQILEFQKNYISKFVKNNNCNFNQNIVDHNIQDNSNLKGIQNINLIKRTDSISSPKMQNINKQIRNSPIDETINKYNYSHLIQSIQKTPQASSQNLLNKNQQSIRLFPEQEIQNNQMQQKLISNLNQSQQQVNNCTNKQVQKQDIQNQNLLQSETKNSYNGQQSPFQNHYLNQATNFQNSSAVPSEFIFHQGIQAALKHFILDSNGKMSCYLSEKSFKENIQNQKEDQSNNFKQYYTYLIFITDQQLNINNNKLFDELSALLINLQVELLIVVLNQEQSLKEHDFRNIYLNQKPVISFFNTEEKLLQYIYNSREHVKNFLSPMIYEHF